MVDSILNRNLEPNTTMGGLLSIFSQKEPIVNLLLIGYYGAGKTTLLYKFTAGGGELKQVPLAVPPEYGEQVAYKNLRVLSWDTGGRTRMPSIHHYRETKGLIYLIDSINHERFGEVRAELHELVQEETLREVPFLLLANKQDQPAAASLSDLNALASITNRAWHLEACCAASGEGLYEGVTWLTDEIRKVHYTRDTTAACVEEKK